jgi:hypothetical protein
MSQEDKYMGYMKKKIHRNRYREVSHLAFARVRFMIRLKREVLRDKAYSHTI